MITWYASNVEPTQFAAGAAVDLGYDGASLAGAETGDDSANEPVMTLAPVSAAGGVIGLALVPEIGSGRVTQNGQPLLAGAHNVFHQDHFQVDEHHVWTASQSLADAVAYNPEEHGADLFCARTKVRIKQGEPVVRCPESRCDLVFLADAFALMLPCHGCGFDPRQQQWIPALPVIKETSIDDLFKKAAAYRRSAK